MKYTYIIRLSRAINKEDLVLSDLMDGASIVWGYPLKVWVDVPSCGASGGCIIGEVEGDYVTDVVIVVVCLNNQMYTWRHSQIWWDIRD